MKKSKFKYLSTTQVLYIHAQMVKLFGGSFGVRELGLIESAVARPSATFNSQDLYADIFDKAAALLQALLKNHPFVDGNKRTALTATGLFLKMNGWRLINTHEEEVEFSVNIGSVYLTLEQISIWIKDHSEKIEEH